MNLIKAGSYAGALIAIGTILNFGYEANAWSGDLKALQINSQESMYNMESRIITREIFKYNMRPTKTDNEKLYKNAMIKQLEQEKTDITVKMRSLRN